MSTSALAANAYRMAQALSTRNAADPSAASDQNRPDFAAMVRDAVGGVVNQGRVSEAKTAEFATGKGNMIDVVTAVSETQLAMETMVAMRDKVISAYEDIMRMPM